jgi:ParB-like chromosome segregation protein Spo0J
MRKEIVSISRLSNNKGQIEGLPKNPRFIKDHKFVQLKQSIKEDPEMLELREVIAVDYNGELVVIAGNMRLNACLELGIKEVPCKILPQDTPIDKLKAITIKDNVGFGEHDWDALANDWNVEELAHWGLDLPLMLDSVEPDDLTEESKNNPPMIKITLESVEQLQQAEIDIQELIDRKYPKAFFSVSAGEI